MVEVHGILFCSSFVYNVSNNSKFNMVPDAAHVLGVRFCSQHVAQCLRISLAGVLTLLSTITGKRAPLPFYPR